MVGASKKIFIGKSAPKTSITDAMTRVARRESPPNSKKLSSIPKSSMLNTADQIAASSTSIGVRGGAKGLSSLGRFRDGGGKRSRSVFPFEVCGNASMTTNDDGIM